MPKLIQDYKYNSSGSRGLDGIKKMLGVVSKPFKLCGINVDWKGAWG